MGFVDELYGNMEAAYKKFSKMFEEHKDYDGSFRIMKGFLIRNKKEKNIIICMISYGRSA